MQSGDFTNRILAYLQSEGKTVNEALLEEGGKRMQFALKRQLMESREDKPGVLRMSSGGHGLRKQWYAYHGEPREALSGRTINTFLTGDLLEVGLSILGRLAGWQLMGKPDGEDEIEIDDVKGHPDDLLFIPEDNEYLVVEYKTMSEYAYRKFEKEGLDDTFGYFTQASLYADALNCKRFILVAMCKNTGHLCDRVYNACPLRVQEARDKWHYIQTSKAMPPRCFEPEPETKYNRSSKAYDHTGRSILGINCSYCPYRASCYPDAQMELKGEKPIWLVPQVEAMAV